MSARRRTRGTGSVYGRNGDWYGRIGKQTPVKLGPAGRGGLTKLQADNKWREVLAAAGARRPGGGTTVGELADLHLARLVQGKRKPSHLRSTRSHLNAWIRPALGDRAAADVEKLDVDQLVQKMTTAGRSAKYVRNVGATLHSLLEPAVKEGAIERNPVDMGDLPKAKNDPTLYFLTLEQFNRVLDAAPGDDAPRPERDSWPTVRLIVLAAGMTGKRHGELDATRWSDLDMSASKIRVTRSWDPKEKVFGPPKSNRPRTVPLPARLLEELDAHHKRSVYNQDDALVFCHPHTGKPIESNDLLEWFRRACDRAGVGRLRPDGKPRRLHDLRHTFGTSIAADPRIPMRSLQAWLGHQHSSTTDIYSAFRPSELEAALVDGAFGGLTVGYGDDMTQHDPSKTPEIAGI